MIFTNPTKLARAASALVWFHITFFFSQPRSIKSASIRRKVKKWLFSRLPVELKWWNYSRYLFFSPHTFKTCLIVLQLKIRVSSRIKFFFRKREKKKWIDFEIRSTDLSAFKALFPPCTKKKLIIQAMPIRNFIHRVCYSWCYVFALEMSLSLALLLAEIDFLTTCLYSVCML